MTPMTFRPDYCPTCSCPLSDLAKFCPECGSKVEPLHCPKCCKCSNFDLVSFDTGNMGTGDIHQLTCGGCGYDFEECEGWVNEGHRSHKPGKLWKNAC